MKRWAIRLFALSAVVGLGWLGFSLAKRLGGGSDLPPPNYAEGPVNGDAATAMADSRLPGQNSGRTETAPAGDSWGGAGTGEYGRAGAANGTTQNTGDPFQRVNQASATGNYGSYGGSSYDAGANSGATSDRGQYATTPPRQFEPDANAAPLAPDPAAGDRGAATANTSARDDFPSASELGVAAARTGNYQGTQSAVVTPASELRYADEGARQTAGIAEPTGQLQVVNDQRASLGNLPDSNGAIPGSTAPSVGTANAQLTNSFPGAQSSRSMNNGYLVQPEAARVPTGAAAIDTATTANRSMPSSNLFPGRDTTGNALTGNSLPMNQLPPPDVASASPIPAASVEGFGKPGEKKLEGAQTPSVTIEKIAPPEIQVGKPAKFQIVVKNTGAVPAENVEVIDPVPQGTQLISQPPRTMMGARGEILWKVGDLKPGEDAKLDVDLMPLSEGEIGSVAVVQFRSTASVRTVATKPDLALELTAPKQVMIGESVTLHLRLANRGTGAASKLLLQARVPPNFQHPAGSELEFDIGQFKPGDTRELDLSLRAAAAGRTTLLVLAQGEGNARSEQVANIEVVAPGLKVDLAGPQMRFLDKQAKYTVAVSNPGTAAARDLQLVAKLPKGMQFVEASDSGHYDVTSNSVMWALDELPAGQNGSVTLTALAKEVGEQKLRSEVRAAGGLSEAVEQVTIVEGVAAVSFTVVDVDDPVEVGGQVTYEIHVVNQGSKAANRLQVMAVFPPEIKPVSGEGPAKQAVNGQQVLFEPMTRLAPKADVTYKVVGQCLVPGDLRIQVLLKTDELDKPVVKEESTKVYKD